jgi:AsmA-like C-terminal region
MRKALIWCTVLALAVISSVVIVIHGVAPRLRETARRRTELYFRTQFQSTVQISDFHVVSLYPRLHVTFDNVVLRHEGRTDVPPLIEIKQAAFEANTLSILRRQPFVKAVRLDGLQIRVPPRPQGAPPLLQREDTDLAAKYPVTIEDVHADGATLAILPRDPSVTPRKFLLNHLELGPVGFDRPAHFEATLTNPVPKGEIQSTGVFGPWNADDPGATLVSGTYDFQNAHLGTLKGLSGTLSSTGKFSGPLNYLSVDGVTETPDFGLRTSRHPVALHTTFSAIVDGTNGNTILNDVVARFLHSTLDVKGEVVDKTPKRGRTIILNAESRGAHVEDLLCLAANSDPVMRGAARLQAKIEIGEGDADLIERLRLKGEFKVSDAEFTNGRTEQKIDMLSLKAQGKPGQPATGNPATDFSGSFRVNNGLVTFSQLSFGVDGASVVLAGNYNLDSGDLDFRGKLRLAAKLSQTTTGVKSFFLKPLDPFFAGKNAGTVLPIKITGTKDQPSFALDFHDKLNRE